MINKLNSSTPFTKRQKEGFGAILNGAKEMTIKYDLIGQGLLKSEGPLKVSKDKIFKISDSGTDSVSNVAIEKIIKVN